ncbi:hypothetical protein DDP54_15470 (plasmid) [Cellulomonas sp. WB94]|uniref:hypothetical protein n=1 Tax=Cellulomonas sp. WB94 TaxID=2173174 RepID=UPI000D5820B3|nr:hypothetical protein [Cellulomonas sp. WB94]PVU81302.1 hypothetical protein DDP54_15470 [Cellulomonas sp. WB94]
MSKFWRDALERIAWSTAEGACTGALAGWGAAAFTTVSGLQAFLTGVAVPAGMALFTAIKVLAARRVGDADSAAIGSDSGKHEA